jgi:dihydroneopterin aldolase
LDHIVITDFRAPARVGLYAWEQLAPQTLQLDLLIGLPGDAPRVALTDSIDYGAVVERLRTWLADGRFDLLEALAEGVATIVLGEFGAPWVRVSVQKLALLRGVRQVGVVIERGEPHPRALR